MPVYIVTGKLGSGKTLCSVARMREYIQRGVPIATNLNVNLHHMWGKKERNINVMRLPDQPDINDLNAIGYGNKTYDEALNGGLFLDECGTWFNARNWADKSRKEVNDWFLHARKLGWDVFLIIQDVELLDAQARKAIAELTVFCRRLDRIGIPLIGPLWKIITEKTLCMPRLHVATAYYGTSRNDLKSETWTYRGTQHYRSYDTKQLFKHRSPGEPVTKKKHWQEVDQETGEVTDRYRDIEVQENMDPEYFGTHCLLTPWHLYGRYQRPWTWDYTMRLTKIYWKKFKAPAFIGAGALAGSVISLLAWPYLAASMQLKAQESQQLIQIEEEKANEPDTGVETGTGFLADAGEDLRTVAADFSGFTIAAHVRNANSQYYLVKAEDREPLTDQQIRSMGYRVFYVNECELMITAADDVSDKTTIFSPGCVPKRSGENLDLSQFSTLQKKVEPLIPTTWALNVQSENGIPAAPVLPQ